MLYVLAASFFLMSDRAEFWDADSISKETEEIVNGKEILADFKSFQGQKVLLLVHGYNNTAKDALETYQTIRSNMEDLNLYDAIIGYLWPGCDEKMEYFFAEKNTQELASRFRSHLRDLSQSASALDIFAHSMGNRLVLEGLQFSEPKPLVRNFYSLAPAVKDKSIEIDHSFYRSTQQCQNMFVFHSNRDDVLKVAFFMAERSEALGYKGVDASNKEPKNVQFIDCTKFVDGHSDYFTAMPVYSFLKYQQSKQIPYLLNGKLLDDGTVVKID